MLQPKKYKAKFEDCAMVYVSQTKKRIKNMAKKMC